MAGPVGKDEVGIGPIALSDPAGRKENVPLVVGVQLAQQREAGYGGGPQQEHHRSTGAARTRLRRSGRGSAGRAPALTAQPGSRRKGPAPASRQNAN